MTTFDLRTLDLGALAAKGQRCELVHPITGEALGDEGARPTLILAGEDSAGYRAAVLASQQKRIDDRPADGDLATIDLAQAAAERRDWIVAATLGFEHLTLDGAPLAYSANAARELYFRFEWIAEQAAVFIGDRRRFLPDVKLSSSPSLTTSSVGS